MYKVGDEVAYGLHGKCVITAIETKELNSGSVSFYQVRTIRNPITARSPGKNEPLILIPVETAQSKGLRRLMTKQDAEAAIKLINEPDYHFEFGQTWVAKQKFLEEVIRKEGSLGLAKVVGHLYVMIKRDAVPPSIVIRFYESVYRLLLRELSEAMQLTPKEVEPLVIRALKHKLSYDN